MCKVGKASKTGKPSRPTSHRAKAGSSPRAKAGSSPKAGKASSQKPGKASPKAGKATTSNRKEAQGHSLQSRPRNLSLQRCRLQRCRLQRASQEKDRKLPHFFWEGKTIFFMVLAFMDLFFVHFVLAFQVDFWPLFQIGLVTTLEDKHKAARRTTGSGQRPSLHQRLHLKMRAGRSQEAEGGRGVPGQHLLPAAEA